MTTPAPLPLPLVIPRLWQIGNYGRAIHQQPRPRLIVVMIPMGNGGYPPFPRTASPITLLAG